MEPIVITAETLPAPQIETILFSGRYQNRMVQLSPLINESGQLHGYQILDSGDMVKPHEITPPKAHRPSA